MVELNKNLFKFTIKHLHQIKKGDLSVLIKKFWSFVILILQVPIYLLSFPIIIFLMLIKPFYLIRWTSLMSPRIGHFAKETEFFCCAEDLKINVPKQKYINLFYLSSKYICNQQLLKMWKRKLIILPAFFMVPLARLNNFLNLFFPGGKDHKIKPLNSNPMRDVFNSLEKTKLHLSFTNEEKTKGEKNLKKFGLNRNDKFVCLIVRDSAFLSKTTPDRDYNYTSFRNADIENFILAAEELTRRGYYVFRMGVHVAKPLISNNKKIIDYSNSELRNDFMDIYLGGNCEFCISTAVGFDEVPIIFRKPIAYVGIAPIGTLETHNSQTLLLIKEHLDEKTNKKMSISEILNRNFHNLHKSKDYLNNSINLLDNTANQIKNLVIEMDERLLGRWVESEEDRNLQKKFWSIYSNNNTYNKFQENIESQHGEIKSKISSKFLKENQYLLN